MAGESSAIPTGTLILNLTSKFRENVLLRRS
jgi:hypothetical protein